MPEFPEEFIRYRVDGLAFDEVTRALASIQPDLVINCIGLIKQMGHVARDPLFSISLNSLLPHRCLFDLPDGQNPHDPYQHRLCFFR